MLVRHVYPTRCATLDKPPGLGDFLRGSIALAHHARARGFDLQLDFSQHPMGRFVQSPAAFRGPATLVEEFFDARATLIYDWLDQAVASGDGGALVTNLLPHASRIDDEICRTVRSQLAFTPDVNTAATALHGRVSDGAFAALHVRVTDEAFKAYRQARSPLIDHVAAHLVPQWGQRIAVFSNNASAKALLCERFGLPLLDTQAVHLGDCDGTEADVRDTLVDFALMGRAAQIHTFSEYNWSSGFSHWCATLHGIPFQRIELPQGGALMAVKRLARSVARRAEQWAGATGGAAPSKAGA